MFLYGLTAGSIIPLSIVYIIRPESLTNLFDFLSSSFLIALNWSDGVAQRFNLSHDLFSSSNPHHPHSKTTNVLSMKLYSCYTIESWYNGFTWLIYFCFLSSLILFIVNQHWKTSEEFFPEENLHEQIDLGLDVLFYYFCIFILALIAILVRMTMEYYLLGYCKVVTLVYLLWYILSFAFVWLWNR